MFQYFCRYEKGQLNFVSERIKLVHGIKNTRLAFQTSKTTIKVKLKSISKFQLLFHCRNFEKYMTFYTLPWSRWNRTHKLWNMCVVPFTIAELSQKCIPANSHACGLKTSISRRLTLAGQFLTPDWKMWVVAVLLDTISKNMLTQTHVRNENHV